MKTLFGLWLIGTAVFLGVVPMPASAQTVALPQGPQAKLSSLSNKQLSTLVDELNAFYSQSLDALFAVNGDEQERQLGARVGKQLLTNYDSRVAGRCTKIIASQTFNQYLGVVHARMAKSEEQATKMAASFVELLKKYALDVSDLRKTPECTVFEYDLEPLYESPLTVYDPGFWWWQKDNQKKTFIRLTVKAQKEDGTIELEGFVAAGSPKGVYHGVGKRDLRSTSINVSLMRDGEPLLVDGELTMSGAAYKDPLTNEVAPKMPARVLSGVLTIHDGDKHTLSNAVMLLARESDAAIGGALGGFKVPGDASYGSYLNVVLVSFKGNAVGRDVAKYAALVDEAYKAAQNDNPVTSFHPTRKPLFLVDDEVAFLVTDIASDVNAEAAKKLRSAETARAAKALGATNVLVVPFYKVKDGKLRIRFPGRPAAELKFSGFEQLAKAIFTMYAGLGQEQDRLLDKFGIKKLSDTIKGFQAEIVDGYKTMGPALDALLEGRDFDADLDKQIGASMDKLLGDGQKLVARLGTVLDTLDGKGFVDAYSEYLRLERSTLELAAAGVAAEKADAAKAVVNKLSEHTEESLARADRFAAALRENTKAIASTLNYMNTFTVHIEFEGTYVGREGKLYSWTWKWDRTMSPELETLFTGEKYDSKKTGRRGD